MPRGGKTLILAHKNVVKPEISDKLLEDDILIEVDWEGNILWEWLCSDHFDELGFSEEAKKTIYRFPGWTDERGAGDWIHINNANTIGPNRWYDEGDERFHPDNIIWTSRESNIIAIIDKRTGKIVWRLGPDYTESPAHRELGQIIGQHHGHIIPRGLPGEGNLLVFDNGGAAGYGAPNPGSPTGRGNAVRYYSRVLEINPVTLKVIWEYSIGYRLNRFKFFSSYVSSAQRLPNGNTMITEGADGRIFELTPEEETVWEYMSPFFGQEEKDLNRIYRAYRVPYTWVPQLEKPEEKPVIPPELSRFRIAAAGASEALVGTWSLVSLEDHLEDGRVRQLLGKDPAGRLMYDSWGNMSVQIMSSKRTPHANLVPNARGWGASNEEMQASLASFASYYGTYDVDWPRRTVTHHIEGAFVPNLPGVDFERSFELTSDHLDLTTTATAARIRRSGSRDNRRLEEDPIAWSILSAHCVISGPRPSPTDP